MKSKLKFIIPATAVLIIIIVLIYHFRLELYSFFTSRGLNYEGGDITITNARIWTGDPNDPWKTSMTIRDGKIVAMNDDDPSGEVIDAEGRLIVPGFCDGHCHPQTPYVLTSPEAPMLFKTKTPEDVLNLLKEYVEEHPDDKYPRMFGWMSAIFKDGQRPTRQMIDEVVSDRPVYLVHHSGHEHWANTKALEIAGIFKETPPEIPNKGFIERDSVTGLATGYMSETELGSTHGIMLNTVKEVGPLSFEEQVLVQRLILEMYSEVGVTSIWTKDGDLDITRIYEQILRDDALPVRAVLDNLYTPWCKMEDLKAFKERADEIENSDLPKGFLKTDGVKLILDLPVHAWQFEPYADSAGWTGHPLFDMEYFQEQVNESDRLGLNINLLIMGNRAAYEGLNAIEKAIKLNPPRERRHSLEHAEFLINDDIPRFKELGVIAVMNPIGSYPEMDYQKYLEEHFGKEKLDSLFHRWKDLIEAGAVVVQGSDFPLAPMDPLVGINIMVNGTDIHGKPEGGLWSHKTISIEDALRTYTTNYAYAAFNEDKIGMLKEGYAADFVMLSENILSESFDPLRIPKVKVMLTVFNGHVVYEDFTDKEKVIDFGQ
ncbi:MAG: amidohydrolase [Ignavibacteria bacterium]|nr:amidohydrolase [Ignavibacteria bacterium]